MLCTVSDVPIYYETYGSGRPIVMLHGYYPDHRLMTGCMEPVFAGRPGWLRLYPDLPGMGRTPARGWIDSTDKMLEVVLGFIDQVLPGRRFALAGESYGGYLAHGIVHRRPGQVAGLFLLCPLVVADASRRQLPPRTTLVADPALMASLAPADAAEFDDVAVVQTAAHWARFRDEVLPGLRLADRPFLERLRANAYGFSFDVDALPRPFDRPSLIVTGRQDVSVGYRDAWDILEQYPRATFAVLDKAGHDLQIEQAGVFDALVGEWLDRVDAQGMSS